jgi:hypothetical protein
MPRNRHPQSTLKQKMIASHLFQGVHEVSLQENRSGVSYSRFHINQPQIVGWALPTKHYCYGFCEVVGDAHPTGNRCRNAIAFSKIWVTNLLAYKLHLQ